MSSFAITLGSDSGAAVLGRPLDIRVQAILAPDEKAEDICVSADVLYGETRVSPAAVRAVLQSPARDSQASVRIQSSVAIDEPVVTVVVRAGCTAPFTRRYVLLADPLIEPDRSARVVPRMPEVGAKPAASGASAVSAPTARAQAEPGASAAVASGASGSSSAAVPARTAERPKVAASPPVRRANSVVRKQAPPAAPPLAAPRLELDAIDLSLAIDPDPVLKLSLSLLTEPASSEEARTASARLWQAINATPEDILRDASRLETATAELATLRAAQAGSESTITELHARLGASRQWQWMVYALGTLLALSLLTLLWLWRKHSARPRFADDKAWWAQEDAKKPPARGPALRRTPAAPALDLDLDLAFATDGRPTSPSQLRAKSRPVELDSGLAFDDADSTPAPLALDQAEFSTSQSASRSVATEELFDVQQQADFFISLGEDEQAIKVLRDHIAESQVPSALAYLDLLKIYHRLGRADDYEQLRTRFNSLFNAGAPMFDQFTDEGRGLEHYERALGRIQALWPDPRVLDVIEQSIFREANDPDTEVFDLEAYRELLLLYAMAKEVIEREAVDSKLPRDFENTKVQALKATARRGNAPQPERTASGHTLPMEQQPPASPNLGLDVNLDDLQETSAFEASLPDVDRAEDGERRPLAGEKPVPPNSQFIDFEVLDFTPADEVKKPDDRQP